MDAPAEPADASFCYVIHLKLSPFSFLLSPFTFTPMSLHTSKESWIHKDSERNRLT